MITLNQLDNFINKTVVFKLPDGQYKHGRVISYNVSHIGKPLLKNNIDYGEKEKSTPVITFVVADLEVYNNYITIKYEDLL